MARLKIVYASNPHPAACALSWHCAYSIMMAFYAFGYLIAFYLACGGLRYEKTRLVNGRLSWLRDGCSYLYYFVLWLLIAAFWPVGLVYLALDYCFEWLTKPHGRFGQCSDSHWRRFCLLFRRSKSKTIGADEVVAGSPSAHEDADKARTSLGREEQRGTGTAIIEPLPTYYEERSRTYGY